MLHTGVWVYPGVWILNWGYTQVFEYARAFGSPNGATYRRLGPNRGYIQVFGFPTAATHGCLDPQPGLHTGVWTPNRGYTRVVGVPSRRLCKLPINASIVTHQSLPPSSVPVP